MYRKVLIEKNKNDLIQHSYLQAKQWKDGIDGERDQSLEIAFLRVEEQGNLVC